MSENIKEIKKRFFEEWLTSIPQLTAFSQNKFYKVVGCLIVGIELINVPNIQGYKPYFVVYPLWKNNLKECLDVPCISLALENKKGLDFSIPYIKHNTYFEEVIECSKRQFPILYNEIITLKSIFDLVENSFNDILVKSNSAQQAKLFELKFFTAVFLQNQSHIQNVLNQIHKASKNWNMQMFEMWHGKFEIWFSKLQQSAIRYENFLQQIEMNVQDIKISKLKVSKFIVEGNI